MIYKELGIIHKKLGMIYKELGIIPKKLGMIYKELGIIPKKLGMIYKELGFRKDLLVARNNLLVWSTTFLSQKLGGFWIFCVFHKLEHRTHFV